MVQVVPVVQDVLVVPVVQVVLVAQVVRLASLSRFHLSSVGRYIWIGLIVSFHS